MIYAAAIFDELEGYGHTIRARLGDFSGLSRRCSHWKEKDMTRDRKQNNLKMRDYFAKKSAHISSVEYGPSKFDLTAQDDFFYFLS